MDEVSSCESSVEQSMPDWCLVEPSTSTRNILNRPHTELTAIRFNLSDYGTAVVASGYLCDLIQARCCFEGNEIPDRRPDEDGAGEELVDE